MAMTTQEGEKIAAALNATFSDNTLDLQFEKCDHYIMSVWRPLPNIRHGNGPILAGYLPGSGPSMIYARLDPVVASPGHSSLSDAPSPAQITPKGIEIIRRTARKFSPEEQAKIMSRPLLTSDEEKRMFDLLAQLEAAD